VGIAAPTGQAAQHYELLESFGGSETGFLANPASALIQGIDGALYGTTWGQGQPGLFRINKDGTGFAVLRHFSSTETNAFCDTIPAGPLLEGRDGRLYGMTRWLSVIGGPCPGDQTVFRLAKDGTGFLVLHSFDDDASWRGPEGGLIEGRDGALYGTTAGGGANLQGKVFKLNKDGSNYTVLHDFGTIPADGAGPMAGLLKGSDGALYGTTTWGGAYTNAPNPEGLGTVFRISEDGSGFAVIHSFDDPDTGWEPQSPLVEGTDGALYGVTPVTAFKLKKDGTGYQVLHQFGAAGDGASARGLIQGIDGGFYGTTESSGTNGSGTVFRLNNDGSAYSILYTFVDDTGYGVFPEAGLLQGSDGALYGTTVNGGGSGTVFRFWPPETPDLLSVARSSVGTRVTFAGVAGQQYQLLRSSDLVTWIALTNLTMAAAGLYTYIDSTPSARAAYYRAAWLP
jgi:uncharacterized repeat protein (TIGR03803 family)